MNNLALCFNGLPNTAQAIQLGALLTQALTPLLENKEAYPKSEKGQLFPKVNFIRIPYRGPSIDHETLHKALSDVVYAVKGLSIARIESSEEYLGSPDFPGIFAKRNTYCQINFE